ncbi:hypothetical protein [Catellatospora vulcania]|uniref:hypothetical protein n=1 Tax=Catellatospora vulcania TaxID=1460450 RepID=UPI0012D49B47|nr:hypothetical protein [Catellatospora vulcania]
MPRPVNTGLGRVLVFVYGLFAVAATCRAGVQIIMKFGEAPVSYLLSALAAVLYIVATVGLVRGDAGGRRLAQACFTVELIGVLAVGTLSVLQPQDFPDATVWSGFGEGYGYLPLVLPVLGLIWLRRPQQAATGAVTEDSTVR